MPDTKEERIQYVNHLIAEINGIKDMIDSESIKQQLSQIIRSLEELRDVSYLFDSGEKELIRLYDRYMPYFTDILKQYASLEESGNYDAIVKSREQLERTMDQLNGVIRTVIKILPQDEIDEANARARAQELRQALEQQRNTVIK